MINNHAALFAALDSVLPTYYELMLTSNTETPCASYMEVDNFTTIYGDTLGYSDITYQVKIWANDIASVQDYAEKIDAALRPLGWVRISSGELYDKQTALIQKIMNYKALAVERF